MCKDEICGGGYGIIHSFGHVIRKPKHLIFGILAFLFCGSAYYLFFYYQSQQLNFKMLEQGWTLELYRSLNLDNKMLLIAALFLTIIYMISVAFFYASLVFYSIRLHEGFKPTIMESIKIGLSGILDFSLLLLAVILFASKVAMLYMYFYNLSMIYMILGLIICGFICLIASFALVIESSEHHGFIHSFKVSMAMILKHIVEFISGIVVLALIFAPVQYLLVILKDRYIPKTWMDGVGLPCIFSTLWLIIGATVWVIFLTRVYRHFVKSKGVIASFFGIFHKK